LICEPFAYSGVGIAQFCTAQLYETGKGGVIAHRGTAREWYQNAADKGVAAAQYWVGMHTRDTSKRKQWLILAVNQGYAPAAYQLFLLLRPENEQALTWLQFAVKENYPPALYRLGLLHSNGYRVSHDLERTRDLWQRSAKAGYPAAMRALALEYARGVIFNIDLNASIMWEQKAVAASAKENTNQLRADERHFTQTWQTQLVSLRSRAKKIIANDPEALRQLSQEILLSAKEDSVQRKIGILILEQAAKGDPDSEYIVANYYLNLQTPTKDETNKGLIWLTNAAESGHRQALRRLIEAHKEGKFGLTTDLYKAKHYSEKLFAVLEENDVPQNNSAWFGPTWDYQDTIKQIKRIEDLPQPIDQLKTKADAGDPEAQYYLAKDIAFYGNDFEKSQNLLEASALGGFPQAQYEMSLRIRSRKRTNEEERQAIDWLNAAAQSNHRGAMVELGHLYMSGLARQQIDRNYYQAKLLYERAIKDKDTIVYQQKTSPEHAWHITVDSVKRRLQSIPEFILRLDLEGLSSQQRITAINKWYGRERNVLNEKSKLASDDDLTGINKAITILQSQRDVLLKINHS
jgi:TPR repeat protein